MTGNGGLDFLELELLRCITASKYTVGVHPPPTLEHPAGQHVARNFTIIWRDLCRTTDAKSPVDCFARTVDPGQRAISYSGKQVTFFINIIYYTIYIS